MGVEETLVMIGLVHTIKGFDHQGELINLLVTYRLLNFFFKQEGTNNQKITFKRHIWKLFSK